MRYESMAENIVDGLVDSCFLTDGLACWLASSCRDTLLVIRVGRKET